MNTAVVGNYMYFATDGNYGDATDIVIVDTAEWTDDDFQLIEDASDSERAEIATRLDEKRN